MVDLTLYYLVSIALLVSLLIHLIELFKYLSKTYPDLFYTKED